MSSPLRLKPPRCCHFQVVRTSIERRKLQRANDITQVHQAIDSMHMLMPTPMLS